MKPHDAKHTKDAKHKMLAASIAFIFLMLLVAAAGAKPQTAAKPPSAFPGGKRGQEAIVALQERLPAIASRYGKSAEVLQEHFLHDRDLWLDANENLLYLCSFDISETETLPESAESAIPTGPFPLAETFQLHSLKGAERVIYLDFDGHVTANTYWNSSFYGGADIVSLPYDFNGNTASFSDAELSRIQNIWARVAEDFAMYDIDVTTEDPGVEALRRSGSGDKQYGIRVVISPSSNWYGSAGGVAYVGSFAWGSDTPVFVFSNKLGSGNEKYVTDATAHETGHALGLAHDGVTGGTSYYQGHGNWAPIMGVGYYKSLTQWSKGEYSGANNTQDDLAVMLNYGASYRADDHGNWIDSATMLSGDTLDAFGIIERTDVADVFGFQSGAGTISITVDPAHRDPNLDIFVQVLDDAGNIIGEADPYNILPADLSLSLPAGTYYILVDGAGTGDPNTGYSDYSSLGQYFITATLPVSQLPPEPPAGLSAAAASSSSISLSWTDNSGNENGFIVERSANGVDGWTEVAYAAADSSSNTDSGLNAGTTYYYRVAAYNVAGNSGYSNSAGATTFALPPAAPANLGAEAASTSQVDLAWTDNATNESGFFVERSASGSENWQEVATVADNTTAYADTGLIPGTYFYRVAAYSENGNSGYSNVADVTTFQDCSGTWGGSAVEDNCGVCDSDPTNDCTQDCAGTWGGTAVEDSCGVCDSDPTNDCTQDQPQFTEQTAAGESSVAGIVSGTFLETQVNDAFVQAVMEQTTGGKPNRRQSLLEHKWMFQVEPGASVTLFANTWASPSTQGDSFVFSYSSDDSNYTEMFTVSSDFDDDNYYVYRLPPDISGTVYLKATDTLRTAGFSEQGTLYVDHLVIRTDHFAGSPPSAPGNLSASGIGYDAVSLAWEDNADNELGFFVERSADGMTAWERVATVGPGAPGVTDTGLAIGSAFFYRVQAFNAAGTSAFSNIAGGSTTEPDTVLHVAALDSSTMVSRKNWYASVTITVRDRDGSPVAGAAVAGLWDTINSVSGVTDAAGQVTLTSPKLRSNVSQAEFRTVSVSKAGAAYDPAADTASSIVVSLP